MVIKSKKDFINKIKSFDINTEHVVIKPNWVSNKPGKFTEPVILDWLLEALPKQKKVVVESYTPWRGLAYKGKNKLDVSLSGGKEFWDFYKEQDDYFLKSTGAREVLKKHKAEYLNITNEFWSGKCVSPDVVKRYVEDKNITIKQDIFYSYVPKRLFDIKEDSTFISLSKIKTEEGIPSIKISMSIKNLFGLIPDPSRLKPYHGKNHAEVPFITCDIYSLYNSLFQNSLWITEGIKTLMINNCDSDEEIIKCKNLFFVGRDAKRVDSSACREMGINPNDVPYLKLIR